MVDYLKVTGGGVLDVVWGLEGLVSLVGLEVSETGWGEEGRRGWISSEGIRG